MVPIETSILTNLRRGVVEYCVLALIEDQPRYGLDLAEALGRGGILLSGEGTLYPLLTRLRGQGLIDRSWEESPNGPPRSYYRLTAQGCDALAMFRRTWDAFSTAVNATVKGNS